MNRPIKFRAWSKIENQMISWVTLSQTAWNDREFNLLYEVLVRRKDDFHVMQFTGLTDRNGVEIYEGDLIRRGMYLYRVFYSPLGARFSYEVVGRYSSVFSNVVKPHKGNGQLYSFLPDPKPVNEVIGNIHTHPELIEPDRKNQ